MKIGFVGDHDDSEEVAVDTRARPRAKTVSTRRAFMMRPSTTDGRFQTTIALEVTLRKMATQIATTANSTMWGTLTLWKYGDDPLDPVDPLDSGESVPIRTIRRMVNPYIVESVEKREMEKFWKDPRRIIRTRCRVGECDFRSSPIRRVFNASTRALDGPW